MFQRSLIQNQQNTGSHFREFQNIRHNLSILSPQNIRNRLEKVAVLSDRVIAGPDSIAKPVKDFKSMDQSPFTPSQALESFKLSGTKVKFKPIEIRK